jgi:hypothetical protein
VASLGFPKKREEFSEKKWRNSPTKLGKLRKRNIKDDVRRKSWRKCMDIL